MVASQRRFAASRACTDKGRHRRRFIVLSYCAAKVTFDPIYRNGIIYIMILRIYYYYEDYYYYYYARWPSPPYFLQVPFMAMTTPPPQYTSYTRRYSSYNITYNIVYTRRYYILLYYGRPLLRKRYIFSVLCPLKNRRKKKRVPILYIIHIPKEEKKQ